MTKNVGKNAVLNYYYEGKQIMVKEALLMAKRIIARILGVSYPKETSLSFQESIPLSIMRDENGNVISLFKSSKKRKPQRRKKRVEEARVKA